MTKEEASRQVALKLAQIDALYNECAKIAVESGLDYFSYSGPAGYGDGGYWCGSAWQSSSTDC